MARSQGGSRMCHSRRALRFMPPYYMEYGPEWLDSFIGTPGFFDHHDAAVGFNDDLVADDALIARVIQLLRAFLVKNGIHQGDA